MNSPAVPSCLFALLAACATAPPEPGAPPPDAPAVGQLVAARGRLQEADAACAAGDRARAVALYEEVLAVRPRISRDAHLRLAECRAATGNVDGACAGLEAARGAYPGDVEVLRALAGLYEQAGKPARALEGWRAVLARVPGDADASAARERLGGAPAPGDAATVPPAGDDVPPPVAALDALLAEGKAEAADEHYRAVVGPSDRAWDHECAGVVFWNHSRFAQAQAALERARALDPGRAEVYAHLGDLALEQGRPAEAGRWYEEGLRRDPNHAELKSALRALREKP